MNKGYFFKPRKAPDRSLLVIAKTKQRMWKLMLGFADVRAADLNKKWHVTALGDLEIPEGVYTRSWELE